MKVKFTQGAPKEPGKYLRKTGWGGLAKKLKKMFDFNSNSIIIKT